MLIIQNDRIRDFIKTIPTPQDVQDVGLFLEEHGTFEFPMLETGLFSAARLAADAKYTGYDNIWVRDNVHIAHAHYATSQTGIACRNVQGLQRYFGLHRRRFLGIIRGETNPAEPMNRPHVRFNGLTLGENSEKWSHAQNDALGYFLWLYCLLAQAGLIEPQQDDWEVLGLFPLFFQAISYWQDEDSGHWEEARKMEASSIGTVVAALREMRRLMDVRSISSFQCADRTVSINFLDELIKSGQSSLRQILPKECIQSDPTKARRYDAALLFLIYPLQVVDNEMTDQILHDVETHLLGDYGIRRYLGDSFWCANYKALQDQKTRTADFSDSIAERDALLRPGQEAQWCIFDPILSAIYGRRYVDTGNKAFFRKQVHYFNRSLGQLTSPETGYAELRCPELYWLDGDRYVPNDVTPLLWTQANLQIALNWMQKTA